METHMPAWTWGVEWSVRTRVRDAEAASVHVTFLGLARGSGHGAM